jgi:hypothetical protein
MGSSPTTIAIKAGFSIAVDVVKPKDKDATHLTSLSVAHGFIGVARV